MMPEEGFDPGPDEEEETYPQGPELACKVKTKVKPSFIEYFGGLAKRKALYVTPKGSL